jgi:pantetheine-phosphate adenylyltransferase
LEKVAIYPGSYDPFTNGHLDIVQRAVRIFPKLIVAVAVNVRKLPTFTVEERVEMIQETLKGFKTVEVDSFSGLLVDYARKRKANVVVRGMRAMSDFENEFQMTHMNRRLLHDLESVFFMTSQEYFYVSSQIVKEVAFFGGDVSTLVPKAVEDRMTARNAGGV